MVDSYSVGGNMSIRFAFLVCVLYVPGFVFADETRRIVDPWEILAKAESIDVVSITLPRKQDETKDFHGYHEFGRVTVRSAEKKGQVISCFAKWATMRQHEEPNNCLVPRHAIHAVYGDVTVDFIICFECGYYETEVTFADNFLDGAKQAKQVLNEVLTAGGVELAPEATKDPAEIPVP